jgi:hypothetical protein
MDIQYVEHLLGDLHYPIDKSQLLQEVEKKGAAEAMPLLSKLPEQKFGSAEEIMQKLPLGSIGGSIMSEL